MTIRLPGLAALLFFPTTLPARFAFSTVWPGLHTPFTPQLNANATTRHSPIRAATTWLTCINEHLPIIFSVLFSAISYRCHHLFPLIATSQHKIRIKGVVSAILIR
ncbi:hypothetical protein Q7I24_12235 [Aeromonas veronii]|uniref:hypothetical protein n=1 Tax=Aeromonas veronii TaxID=654 RepID=UPI0030056A7C